MMPRGFVTISKLTQDGKEISTQDAVDSGLIIPYGEKPKDFYIPKHEVPLGDNLFLDQGRQLQAYCFGFAAPIQNYVCSQFGVGTGTSPSKVTDTALQNPVEFTAGVYLKDINGVDYPAPFIARVEFTLGNSEANGYLLTEMGLYSGDGTLIARKIMTGINKTSSLSPTLSWRIRF